MPRLIVGGVLLLSLLATQAVADGEFAGVRVEHAPKRSTWSAMTPGPVVEKRQHDGSVIAELNGNAMVPTRLQWHDGRLQVACAEGGSAVDFRQRHRAEEQ